MKDPISLLMKLFVRLIFILFALGLVAFLSFFSMKKYYPVGIVQDTLYICSEDSILSRSVDGFFGEPDSLDQSVRTMIALVSINDSLTLPPGTMGRILLWTKIKNARVKSGKVTAFSLVRKLKFPRQHIHGRDGICLFMLTFFFVLFAEYQFFQILFRHSTLKKATLTLIKTIIFFIVLAYTYVFYLLCLYPSGFGFFELLISFIVIVFIWKLLFIIPMSNNDGRQGILEEIKLLSKEFRKMISSI